MSRIVLSVLRTAGSILLVAGAYFAAGRLGLLLAIPPGYATAVWPPSGIALAAVLLGGPRVVPGIFLGSFLLNVSTGFSPEALELSLGLPAAIALGAALEALVGAWLIRRGGYEINLLASGQGAVQLLLLGGPLACLVNATVSVLALWLGGKMSLAEVPFNWWTWWIGDSIGVLLFTPLLLIWAVRPYRTWLRRQVFVTAPLVLLFAVVVMLFVFISRREQNHIETEFDALTQDLHQSLRVRLNAALNVLASIEGLYASSERVEPREFETFARRLIVPLEGVTALSWNPVVRDQDRKAFEASAQRSGLTAYRITERAPDGTLVTALQREMYVPVQTIVPRAGNETALGFDTASEPVRRLAMNQACDTGAAVASGRVRLIQNRGQGLLVVMPVYREARSGYRLQQCQRSVRGYAVAVYDVQGLVADQAERAQTRDIVLRLFDEALPQGADPIYGDAGALPPGLSRTFRFNFASRPWRLEFSLPDRALVARRSWGAWLVLAGGLLLTGLLGMLLLVGVGRTAQIEQLVTERTDALRRTAAQLQHSNRELEQFAYVTSHDLKAPLRTVSSFAELLEKRHGVQLGLEGREFLKFITDGVRQMQSLIDDLLELSRVGSRKLAIAPVPMRTVVDRACSALAADLASGGVKLHVAEMPVVPGDLQILTPLWQNLLANAIKFRRPGQASEIWIDAVDRGHDWQFSVRDNGIGIDPRHLDQIFLVFRRLHTAEEYPGTGIGLAICKKIVQMHGGDIWAESTPGAGATFRFTLPKITPAAQSAA